MSDQEKETLTSEDVGVIPSTFQVSIGLRRRGLGQAIEAAMAQAILDANAEGISSSEENSVVLRERMMAAREAVKEAWAARFTPKEDKE